MVSLYILNSCYHSNYHFCLRRLNFPHYLLFVYFPLSNVHGPSLSVVVLLISISNFEYFSYSGHLE